MSFGGRDAVAEVRERADIVAVIGGHVRLRRVGRNHVGLCPFHSEKTPSFSVNGERGFFHCFGCGAGGTVFDFVMRLEGLSFAEALESLARRFGVELPARTGEAPRRSERERLFQVNELAAEFYVRVLERSAAAEQARAYLKSRAISGETVRAFRLGFAPPQPAALAAALARRGLIEAGIATGLVRRGPEGVRDLFAGRLIFPIRDSQGRVIAFGGRVLDDRLPKYLNSPESPVFSKGRSLYGLYEARQAIARADRAILVEGYFDAIVPWQAGMKEVVASLGTALTADQLKLLSRYTRNISACFDGDEAGRRASMRSLENFLAAGLLGRGVFLPAGFDPDTLVRERGVKELEQLVASARLLIDFFLSEESARAGDRLEKKADAARRVAELLRIVGNPFEFDLLARRAASALEVSEELLRREAFKGNRSRDSSTGAKAGPAAAGSSAESRARLGLLALAMRFPELRVEIVGCLSNDDADEAAVLIREICASGDGAAAAPLEEKLSQQARAALAGLLVGEFAHNAEQGRRLVADYAAALARRRVAGRVNALRRAAAASDDSSAAARASQELIELRRESSRLR